MIPPLKRPIERKIVRIVTPGTVSDEALLPERQDNLIVAVYQEKEKIWSSHIRHDIWTFPAL